MQHIVRTFSQWSRRERVKTWHHVMFVGLANFPFPLLMPCTWVSKKDISDQDPLCSNFIVQRAGIGERWLKQMTLAFTTCADEVSRLSRISWPSEQIETITILEQCLGFQWYHTEHVSDGFNCFASTLFGINTCILTKFSFSCFDHNHLVIRDVKSSSSMQIVTLNHQDCNLNSRSEWICLVYVLRSICKRNPAKHLCHQCVDCFDSNSGPLLSAHLNACWGCIIHSTPRGYQETRQIWNSMPYAHHALICLAGVYALCFGYVE